MPDSWAANFYSYASLAKGMRRKENPMAKEAPKVHAVQKE